MEHESVQLGAGPDEPSPTRTAKTHETSADVRGWRFLCRSQPAMSSDERDALARALRLKPLISLPEMVFAGNQMVLRHAATGLSIQFKAVNALRRWSQQAHAELASDYNGSVAIEKRSSSDGESQYIPVIGVKTAEKLPLEKLMQQVQILYFDKVILFEDDVRDLGEIYLEVKIRVMEFGFLLLCRYYCRLDEKLVKLVDTRYYHEFSASFIWRDQEVREETIPELHRLMYPSVQRISSLDGADKNNTQQQHSRHFDFSADAVYQAVQPSSSVTEKIPLPIAAKTMLTTD